MVRIFAAIGLAVIFLTLSTHAQQDTTRPASKEEVESVSESVDGINETVAAMKTTLDALKKIKVSGYIQFQYQMAESASVPTFSGGDFAANVKSRFLLRRLHLMLPRSSATCASVRTSRHPERLGKMMATCE